MNYIKDIQLKTNNIYNIIIEIPKHTKHKYELNDKTFDKIDYIRDVYCKYPFYYGCFPQTLAGDNDPLDMILFTNKKHKILDIVEVIPFATIKTLDNNEQDDKILVVEKENINYNKLIKKAFKFLSRYKGKNSNMIIDKNVINKKDTLKLIEEAHLKYLNKNNINNSLSIRLG